MTNQTNSLEEITLVEVKNPAVIVVIGASLESLRESLAEWQAHAQSEMHALGDSRENTQLQIQRLKTEIKRRADAAPQPIEFEGNAMFCQKCGSAILTSQQWHIDYNDNQLWTHVECPVTHETIDQQQLEIIREYQIKEAQRKHAVLKAEKLALQGYDLVHDITEPLYGVLETKDFTIMHTESIPAKAMRKLAVLTTDPRAVVYIWQRAPRSLSEDVNGLLWDNTDILDCPFDMSEDYSVSERLERARKFYDIPKWLMPVLEILADDYND